MYENKILCIVRKNKKTALFISDETKFRSSSSSNNSIESIVFYLKKTILVNKISTIFWEYNQDTRRLSNNRKSFNKPMFEFLE